VTSKFSRQQSSSLQGDTPLAEQQICSFLSINYRTNLCVIVQCSRSPKLYDFWSFYGMHTKQIQLHNLTQVALNLQLNFISGKSTSIYLWLYSPLLELGRFFSFLIPYTVARTPWTGDQPVARPLPTQSNTTTE
jgi:hypothetical protein